MTFFRYLAIASTLSLVVGCGSDDDDSGGTGGAGTGGAGTGGAGTGGAGTGGAGTGGAGTGGAAGADMGGAGMGGMGGMGGSAGGGEAATFCADYETTCGFGGAGLHADMDACVAAYEGYDAARQTCVTQHLGFASGDTATHCPHATGAAPCN